MKISAAEWEATIAQQWSQFDAMQGSQFVESIDALADVGSDASAAITAAALFERACARDSVGMEAEAEHFYRAALASDDLDGYRRSRASIQLASTLRLLGRLDESEQLLISELDRHLASQSRELHDEARAILALTYVAQGRAVEAAGLALVVLAPHLSRYNRSMANYGLELVGKAWN
jgi:tetratricopeptide (TPR) repeat protein